MTPEQNAAIAQQGRPPHAIEVGCIVSVKSDPLGHKPLMVRSISVPAVCECECGLITKLSEERTIHVEWLEERAGQPFLRWRVRTGHYPESMLHRVGGPVL